MLVMVSTWALRRSRRGDGDIAKQAEEYLQARDVVPLDANGKEALTEPTIGTLPHPLLGQAAPGFRLTDFAGHKRTLREHTAHGPVVLIFYYGYCCNH